MSDNKNNNSEINVSSKPMKIITKEDQVDYKVNYDTKQIEVTSKISDKSTMTFILTELLAMVIIGFFISIFLTFAFKITYLNFSRGLSIYLFTVGGLMMLLGSIMAIYSESPSLQALRHRKEIQKIQIKKSENLYLLLFAGIIVIILSFVVNAIASSVS